MPPKPAPGKGGKGDENKDKTKVKEGPEFIDEYDTMDAEQLQDELRKAMMKFNEVRRNRNYFQLERVCRRFLQCPIRMA